MRYDITSPSDGYAYAIDVLSRQDRSCKDLHDRIIKKGFSEIIAEAVIIKLKDLHYLDDVRLAENYLRTHVSLQSVALLKQKLYQKGVEKDDIDTALEHIREDDMSTSLTQSQTDAVYSLLIKKHFLEEGVDRQKVLAGIYRRGYSPDVVRQAVLKLEEAGTD